MKKAAKKAIEKVKKASDKVKKAQKADEELKKAIEKACNDANQRMQEEDY